MNFKKIVITGGSRGIGRAFVDQFINRASEIHVISRNFHDQPPNSNLFFHPLDLSESKKIPAFIDNLVKEYGVPDLLINNAGSGAFYEWSEFPDAEILKQINLLFLVPVLSLPWPKRGVGWWLTFLLWPPFIRYPICHSTMPASLHCHPSPQA